MAEVYPDQSQRELITHYALYNFFCYYASVWVTEAIPQLLTRCLPCSGRVSLFNAFFPFFAANLLRQAGTRQQNEPTETQAKKPGKWVFQFARSAEALWPPLSIIQHSVYVRWSPRFVVNATYWSARSYHTCCIIRTNSPDTSRIGFAVTSNYFFDL